MMDDVRQPVSNPVDLWIPTASPCLLPAPASRACFPRLLPAPASRACFPRLLPAPASRACFPCLSC